MVRGLVVVRGSLGDPGVAGVSGGFFGGGLKGHDTNERGVESMYMWRGA